MPKKQNLPELIQLVGNLIDQETDPTQLQVLTQVKDMFVRLSDHYIEAYPEEKEAMDLALERLKPKRLKSLGEIVSFYKALKPMKGPLFGKEPDEARPFSFGELPSKEPEFVDSEPVSDAQRDLGKTIQEKPETLKKMSELDKVKPKEDTIEKKPSGFEAGEKDVKIMDKEAKKKALLEKIEKLRSTDFKDLK